MIPNRTPFPTPARREGASRSPHRAPCNRVCNRVCIRRRGLAPLEFVLTLPILLFVMALIIDFGNIACWKVRTATVARQAVWRQRGDRRGATDPRPAGWPSGAGNPQVSNGQSLFADPFAQYAVARGPMLGDANGTNQIQVHQSMLDITTGVRVGSARMRLTLPLLPNLEKVRFSVQHPLLSSGWRFQEMNLPRNEVRRTPFLYPQLDSPVFMVPTEREAHRDAASNISNASFRPAMMPLDRDDEFYAYNIQFNSRYMSPDFHPRALRDLANRGRCTMPGYDPPPPQPTCFPACEIDPTYVQEEYVRKHLLPDIKNVPRTMKNAFLALYRQQQNNPTQATSTDLTRKISQVQMFATPP